MKDLEKYQDYSIKIEETNLSNKGITILRSQVKHYKHWSPIGDYTLELTAVSKKSGCASDYNFHRVELVYSQKIIDHNGKERIRKNVVETTTTFSGDRCNKPENRAKKFIALFNDEYRTEILNAIKYLINEGCIA